ncbi:PilX N-terminal domain-containing pilus assembly protein [Zooshikella ganghwensis]|uniref:PilX N-terminal domain-containing pilus assembly protein n=1 Tax=Zooshikella ganghwensis TaxID=202772 RepID=UPI0004268416|nr:PilX N-terminal domain-containing pilus assembly protein [Zooshikella ganghwensis]
MEKQKGSALIVSLIILIILTVIGFSASRTTVLEERMASNSQNKLKVYQLGISELNAQFVGMRSDPSELVKAIKSKGTPQTQTAKVEDKVTVGATDKKVSEVDTELTYISDASIPDGEDLPETRAYRYHLDTEVEVINANVQTDQTLGFQYEIRTGG